MHETSVKHEEAARVFQVIEGALLESGADRATALVALLSVVGMQFANRQMGSEELHKFVSDVSQFITMYLADDGVRH